MKSIFAIVILFLSYGPFVSADQIPNGLPVPFQPCEMAGDSFKWLQTNFSPEEWSLNCLNSKFIKLYEQDDSGKIQLKTSLSKSTVQAAFYLKAPKGNSLAPETKFFMTKGPDCKDKLELSAAMLWRNGKKYVEISTGICTQIPTSQLENGQSFELSQLADTAQFEDYDHEYVLLAINPDAVDLVGVLIHFAKDEYEHMEQTKFELITYLPHSKLVSSLPQHFICGDILTGAHFLPKSQKLLLDWINNLSVFDYSNMSHSIFYRDPATACVAVAYGFGGFDLFRMVFVSSEAKSILFLNSDENGKWAPLTFQY